MVIVHRLLSLVLNCVGDSEKYLWPWNYLFSHQAGQWDIALFTKYKLNYKERKDWKGHSALSEHKLN